MLDKFDKNKVFSRRIFFILVIKLILIFFLILRLIYLQFFRFNKFSTLADSNRIKSLIIPPLRGKVFDKNGKIIASNTKYYRILLNPAKKLNIPEALSNLAKTLKIEEKELLYYKNKKNLVKSEDGYILVYDDLTWDQLAKVEANIPDLPGIYIEEARRRFYPNDAVASNILGYVAAISKKEHNKDNILLSHPDFKIGKIGIEKLYENYLRGKAGIFHIEVDAYGHTIRNSGLQGTDSVAGSDLNLTIDIDLQKYIFELLGEKEGAVSVLNIKTGAVEAIVSKPSFNANLFVSGISHEEWGKLVDNPSRPMVNKAVSEKYPPGSTFKLISAIAALENGIDPKKELYCNGKLRLGRRIFHCWKKIGHGQVNLVKAIKESCNIYFYKISRKVGIKNIVDVAKEFGLGEKTDISLFNEKAGLLPSKKWKKEVIGENWVLGDTYNNVIGQGFMEVTNLQLAVMTARLASRGKKVEPYIVKENKKVEFTDIDIKKENIDLVLKGMYQVTNVRGGTAYWSGLRGRKYRGYRMAGKTGTAQVVTINHKKEQKDLKDIDYKKRNHGLFVGYAPFHDPKYAISVIIEHGGSGSGSAAPVGKRVMQYLKKRDKV